MLPKDRSSLLFNETPDPNRGPPRDMPTASPLVAMARHRVYCSGGRWEAPNTDRSWNCEVGRRNRTGRHSALAGTGCRTPAALREWVNEVSGTTSGIASVNSRKADPMQRFIRRAARLRFLDAKPHLWSSRGRVRIGDRRRRRTSVLSWQSPLRLQFRCRRSDAVTASRRGIPAPSKPRISDILQAAQCHQGIRAAGRE